jgi:hypothetical protein
MASMRRSSSSFDCACPSDGAAVIATSSAPAHATAATVKRPPSMVGLPCNNKVLAFNNVLAFQ